MTFLEEIRVETEDFLDETFEMTLEELLESPKDTLEEAINQFEEKISVINQELDDLDVKKLRLKAQVERYRKQRIELLNRLKK